MNRYAAVAGIAVIQLLLTGIAVAPQLSARTTGESHLVRVELYDPIDPFRGAYVSLDYPDLRTDDSESWERGLGALAGEKGDVFIVLEEEDGVMVATDWVRERPEDGVYLSCQDPSWQIHCGIESWFVPQDEARDIERMLMDSGALAELRIDRWGHAAIVDLRAP